MRAFAVRNFGEAPALYDLPIPNTDSAFLIRVTYAGINPLDNILAERLTATSKYPFVLGVDFAGIVERAPEGELSLRAGMLRFLSPEAVLSRRVMQQTKSGSLNARSPHSILQHSRIHCPLRRD
jgi:NADPH:quinone reductase-like Zn-dependent oxidoreductase